MTWMLQDLPQDQEKVYIKQLISGPIEVMISIITSAKLDLDGDTS